MRKLVSVIIGLALYAGVIAIPVYFMSDLMSGYSMMESVDEYAVEVVVSEAVSYNQLVAGTGQVAVSGYEIVGIEFSEDQTNANIYAITSSSIYTDNGDSYTEVESSDLYLMLVGCSVSVFGYEMTEVMVCDIYDDEDLYSNIPIALFDNLEDIEYYTTEIAADKINIINTLLSGGIYYGDSDSYDSSDTVDFVGDDIIGEDVVISGMLEDLKEQVAVDLLYSVGSYQTTEAISGELVEVYYLTTQTVISDTSSVLTFSKTYYIGTQVYLVSATYRLNADDFVCIQIIE